MRKIVITTDGQNLAFSNLPEIFSGSVNYDEVEFIFDDSWNGLNKTAVFSIAGSGEKIPVDLTSDNVAKIPSSITSSSGIINIGVNGISDDKTILKTSQIISYSIGDGVMTVSQEVSDADTSEPIQNSSRIIISTDDQNLSYDNMPEIFSGDVNYDLVKFNFDETWDSFAKTAVFYIDPSDAYGCFVDPEKDYTVKIPSVLIKESCVINIGVYGVKDDVVKTSQILKYKIYDGCIITNRETEETPVEYWKQVLTSVESVRKDMESDVENLKAQDKKLFEYAYQLLNTDKKHDSEIDSLKDNVSSLKADVGTIKITLEDVENYLAELIKATTDNTKDFLSIIDTTTVASDENTDSESEEVTDSDSE